MRVSYRAEVAALLLLLAAIAAFFRFYQPTLVEYFHDEAMLATMAQELARDGIVPLTGILSSTGIPNPPASVYVMAVPFLLTPDPAAATLFVMLLNVGGVLLLYGLLRASTTPAVAFAAALLYAAHPWAIWYSRRIWAQDFHTPFLLAGLMLLWIGLARHRGWAQALAWPVTLFGMQVHFAAWALLPAYALVLWQRRADIRWRWTLLGVALAALVLLPYAAGLAQTLAIDPARITSAVSRAADTAEAAPPLLALGQLITLMSGQIDPATANRAQGAAPHLVLVGLPFIALALLGTLHLLRQPRPLRQVWLWWAYAPALLLALPLTPPFPHYFVASIPALCVLVAYGLWWSWQRLPAVPLAARAGLLGLLIAFSGVQWFATLATVTTGSYRYPDFTTPLADLLIVRDTLAAADDVVVVSDGMAWDLKHDVAVWETLLRERASCVRTVRDGYRVLPNRGFFALITADGQGTHNADHYRAAGTTILEVLPRQIERFSVVVLPQPERPAPQIPVLEGVFDAGAALQGIDRHPGGLTLHWTLGRYQPRGVDFQYTVQAFDAAGGPLGQHDGRFWHGMSWCAGDWLMVDVPFTVPPDAAEVRVGLYRFGTQPGQLWSANRLDRAGNPAGTWVSVPLR